jgi:tRNA pseudouridine38-40 synthase
VNNYKLLIQYDGTEYAGWQIQKNAPTVQRKITDAIRVITKENVNLIGSGRTDSGVHALGQAANFRVERELDTYRFQYSLNSLLPSDISILKTEKVDDSFHARFDAKNRSYLYLFSHIKSPFYNRFSHHLPPVSRLDFECLNRVSRVLLGEHDFSSYSRKNAEIEDKSCIVTEIRWRRGKEFSTFFITANRFLHGMVRTIIGTLLYAPEENFNDEYLLEVMAKKNRENAGEAVPAKGLFLYKVRY